MAFAKIGDITLHYRIERGDATQPLLVFVNSLGTDFRIWDAVLPHLAGHYSVLLYDKRGHGLSDTGETPYSIEDHVDDLEGLLNHLGAGEIALCGLSVGGLIAQGLAARRPEQVTRLILCDTAHRIGSPESWTKRIDAIEKHGMGAIADGVVDGWFTADFRANSAASLAGFRTMLVRQPADGYSATCVALRDADHTVLVQSLSMPTLCLAGDQDRSTPPELVKAMADLIPSARFGVIADAGHIPCVEQPAALAAQIGAFLGGFP